MKLEVKVKKLVYTDAKTNFRILKGQIKSYELGELEKQHEMAMQKVMTLKGDMIYCSEGDTYIVDANFKVEDRGVCLYINSALLKKIELEDELEKYLIRNVKGVGKARAKSIIEALGAGAVDIITASDGRERLLEVVKNEKLTDTIRQHLLDNANIFTIMNFLQANNLDVKIANKILKEYKKEGLLSLRDNPYYFIRAIDFSTLDKIASKQKYFDKKDPRRIGAGVIALVNNGVKNKGDVYTHIDTIYDELQNYINDNGAFEPIALTSEEITEAIKTIKEEGGLHIENGKYLYLKYLLNKENDIVFHIKRLNVDDKRLSTRDILSHIEAFEKETRLIASDEQKEAVVKALQNNFSILTGLPGAGKTFTINLILKIYKKLYPQSVIRPLAPTGKASKRMEEMSGIKAETIHRALKIIEGLQEDGEELDADFVIIDEASMLDIYLAGTLLSNIKKGTKVLIVGDVEQLPSVGAGLILRDLIDSGVIPTTRLTKLFRQGENSNIVKNAHAIVNETLEFEWKKDAIFWESNNVADIENKIVAGYKRLLELGYSRQEIGILSPQKAGDLGTQKINKIIQEKFNKGSKEITINRAGDKIREKDLVMHTVNNYDLDVFNGEVGVVAKIDYQRDEYGKFVLDKDNNKKPVVYVRYADKSEPVIYTEDFLDQLELAYCITIHKSQGSEYRAIMSVISHIHDYMLGKNLIYTAWTRAKEFLVVIGSQETLNKSVLKKDAVSRLSNLSPKLQGEKFNKYVEIKDRPSITQEVFRDVIGGVEYTYTLDEVF